MSDEVRYVLGHSEQAFSSQQSRTAEHDAAFLIPYIQPSFRILDFGCGPGTISAGLAKYVPSGQVIAVDISPKAIAQARRNAAALPDGCPANLKFHCIDVLRSPGELDSLDPYEETHPRPDGEKTSVPDEELTGAFPAEWLNSFDVIYDSMALTHLPTPVKAVQNMKQLLKPATGIFATRAYDVHTCTYLPDPSGLCARIGDTLSRLAAAGSRGTSSCLGRDAPFWLAQAGLPQEKMLISGTTTVYATSEARKWWGKSMAARYDEGDSVRDGMIKRGILSATECDQIRDAILGWSKDPSGYYFWTAIQVVVPVQ